MGHSWNRWKDEAKVKLATRSADQWGPSPRPILNAFLDATVQLNEDFAITVDSNLLATVAEAAAKVAQTGPIVLDDCLALNFSEVPASPIFFCRPDPTARDQAFITIPSDAIGDELCKALARRTAADQHRFFSSMQRCKDFRTGTGFIFENYVHTSLMAAGFETTCHSANKQEKILRSVPEDRWITGTQAALANVEAGHPFYWRPPHDAFPGIDALLYDGIDVSALQITIAPKHRAVVVGLDKVWQAISASVRCANWHVVLVGSEEAAVRSVRDGMNLTGRWANCPVFACVIPFP